MNLSFLGAKTVVYRYKLSDEVPVRVRLSWLNLSFTAGAINAGAFLSCQRFVSHVTGFVTISGLDFVENSWREALSALSIPGYFMLGAMISAYLSEHEGHQKHRFFAKNFALAMAIVAIIMVVQVILGHAGYFGKFGAIEDIQSDYLQLALFSMACGIQNAAVTSATGASIRPTHLTGTTTDLGIGLVRAAIHPTGSKIRRQELIVNGRRFYLIVAFVLGAMIGSLLCAEFEYLGFLLPAAMSAIAVVDSLRQTRSVLTTET